jgi:hypothetical protein
MRIIPFLTAVVLLGGAWAVTTSEAAAQECTVKCQCLSSGCGCQSSGGNGSGCDASGDGCFVQKCDEVITSSDGFVTPDGLLRLLPAMTSGQSRLASGLDRDGEWETSSHGQALARDCSGIVVQRYFSRSYATTLRESSRVLSTE